MMDQDEIDLGNWQMVGVQGDFINVMMPRQQMTRDQALVHAAWIVALADDYDGRFESILKAVQNT